MANLYNTRLVCTSNSKLLQKIDPDEIIKEPNSEFLSCENGAYHFTTRDGTMHESIVALSKKYPTEIFIAQFWNVEFYDSEIQTYKYFAGSSKCTKVGPNYGYCISHIEKLIGKKTVWRFMKVALKQIKRIDAINDIPTAKNNRMERKHKISSSITINVEDEDFKIEATKIGSSYIEVNGFIKEVPTPRWQLIEKEKNRIVRVAYPLDKSNDEAKDDKFDELPFDWENIKCEHLEKRKIKTNELKTMDYDVDYEGTEGVDECMTINDYLHEELYNEYIDDPCLLLHLHHLNVYQIDYPRSSLGHPDVFKAAREAFTPVQVIALYHYSNFDAKQSNCPIDRKTKIIKALEESNNLLEYKITDVLEFQEKIRWMPPIFFQDFTNILYRSGIMMFMYLEDNDILKLFERNVAHAMEYGCQEARIGISNDSYTILECSNPNLISTDSKFVNESVSQLVKIHNFQTHFFQKETRWIKNLLDYLRDIQTKYSLQVGT